ncbi:MAG: hypothetical protein PHN49_03995, partial [Candidatus Omnitrophica bacterium]|nr:hypothetical protein [Candidatus Omnitrophota bacterium]
IAGETKYTKQKTLANGYTLIATPVDEDGNATVDTTYSKQKELADGSVIIASPVNEDGSDIADETKYTKQKTLASGYTLIATPVDEDGNATADTTYSKQKELADGSVVTASPVYSDGSDISGATKYTKQKTLASGYTLISVPVDQDGNATADTKYSKQKTLQSGEWTGWTLTVSDVDESGTDTVDSKYSLQKGMDAGQSLTMTDVDAVTYAKTADSQVVHSLSDALGNTTEQRVYEGPFVKTLEELNAKIADETLKLVQIIYFKEDVQIVQFPSSSLTPNDITPMPGTSYDLTIAPQGNGSSVVGSSRGITFNYDTTVGGFAGGGFGYSDSVDLSGLSQLVFGIQRTAGSVGNVIFKIEDVDGKFSMLELSGISGSEQVWAISTSDLEALGQVDLTRVKLMFFTVVGDSETGVLEINRIPQPATGGNLNQSNALDTGDIVQLPSGLSGFPQIARAAPDGNTSTVSASDFDRGVVLDYDTNIGGWAGGGFTYDDFGTEPDIETGDLSGISQFTFGLKGDVGTVKLEILDKFDQRAVVYLTGINSLEERVWVISKSSMSNSSAVDFSKIRSIFFIVEGTGQTGLLEINRIPGWVQPRETQLIVDYVKDQTTQVLFDENGQALRQNVYEGRHTELGELVIARLLQSVFFLPNQQLVQDTQNNQTTLLTFDADGRVVQEAVYAGIHTRAQLDALQPFQVVVYEDVIGNEDIARVRFAADYWTNETSVSFYDADGNNVNPTEVYEGEVLSIDDYFATNGEWLRAIYIVDEHHQYIQMYDSVTGLPITVDQIYDDQGRLQKADVWYQTVQETDPAALMCFSDGTCFAHCDPTLGCEVLAERTFVIDATHQLTYIFEVDITNPFADYGEWGETKLMTFDADTGKIGRIDIYDGTPGDIDTVPTDYAALLTDSAEPFTLVQTILPFSSEDTNGNGSLDAGEDSNGNGDLDMDRQIEIYYEASINAFGMPEYTQPSMTFLDFFDLSTGMMNKRYVYDGIAISGLGVVGGTPPPRLLQLSAPSDLAQLPAVPDEAVFFVTLTSPVNGLDFPAGQTVRAAISKSWRTEDLNGNGLLDEGEDLNENGALDLPSTSISYFSADGCMILTQTYGGKLLGPPTYGIDDITIPGTWSVTEESLQNQC